MKSIEWAEKTINPIQDTIKGESGRGYHCTKVSAGCQHCYAEVINKRFGNGLPFDNRRAEFELIRSELDKPLKWKKPKRIFVQSMGDLFYESVDWCEIAAVFGLAVFNPQHTFLFLTKRPERMAKFFTMHNGEYRSNFFWWQNECCLRLPKRYTFGIRCRAQQDEFPLPNIYLGVTAENQKRADERIPTLVQIPAKVRFISIEPILSEVNIEKYLTEQGWCPSEPGLEWVIVGAETGPGKRPAKSEWIENIIEQCKVAKVPLFMKPNLEPYYDGKLIQEFPK